MSRRTIELTSEQRRQLQRMVRCDPKPYRRERAACLLKIAAGQVAVQVARNGLLRPRDPDTVYAWLDRFEEQGIEGLTIRAGRGRKPSFSPSDAGGGPGATARPGV